jgi:hypothetical protein
VGKCGCVLKGHDFTGRGKTRRGRSFVKGHDFSQAVKAAKSPRASAPEGCFWRTRSGTAPFPGSCSVVPQNRPRNSQVFATAKTNGGSRGPQAPENRSRNHPAFRPGDNVIPPTFSENKPRGDAAFKRPPITNPCHPERSAPGAPSSLCERGVSGVEGSASAFRLVSGLGFSHAERRLKQLWGFSLRGNKRREQGPSGH